MWGTSTFFMPWKPINICWNLGERSVSYILRFHWKQNLKHGLWHIVGKWFLGMELKGRMRQERENLIREHYKLWQMTLTSFGGLLRSPCIPYSFSPKTMKLSKWPSKFCFSWWAPISCTLGSADELGGLSLLWGKPLESKTDTLWHR